MGHIWDTRMGSVVSTPMPRTVLASTTQNQVFGDQHVHGDQIFHVPSDARKELVQACLESLAYPEMNDRYNDIEMYTGQTCEWLFRHDEWKRWISSPCGLLWIRGKPGSGKSTLLRYALDNLKSTEEARDALVLSFFFHGRGNDLQKSQTGFFRSLLYQVLSQAPDTLTRFVATFQQRRDGISRPDAGQIWNFHELRRSFNWSIIEVSRSRPVYIFVDAIDECGADNAKAIIRYLQALRQGPFTCSNLSICFTCRHYPSLVQGQYHVFGICPDRENREDILAYTRARLSDLEFPTTLALPNLITDCSNGLFIWARLVIDQILDLELADDPNRAEGQINEIIDTVPRDLDELYADLVRGLEENPEFVKLMRWIRHAERPMSLDELRWAMALDPKLHHWCNEDNHATERRVKLLSHGLIETVSCSNTRTLQFIHQSVKDFFDARPPQTPEQSPGDRSYLIAEVAHYQLYETCIHYLSMEQALQLYTPSLSNCPRRDSVSRAAPLSDHPFLSYATTSWLWHLGRSQQISQGGPQRINWPSDTVLQRWVKAYHLIDRHSLSCPPAQINLVHILARYGWAAPLQNLLSEEYPVNTINARDQYGRTPLLYAAEGGHLATVEVLLESQAQLDIQDLSGASPLHWAALRGHEEIMRRLLEGGADAELKDNGGCTPLVWAMEGAWKACIQMLLETDPNLNYKYTLLSITHKTHGGRHHSEVERFYGVDSAWRVYPDSKRDSRHLPHVFWMPREESCWATNFQKQLPWWKRLLSLFGRPNGAAAIGAQRDGGTPGDRTPLLRAVELGCQYLVMTLLGKGADPDFKCRNGWSPILLAKSRRSESDKVILKLLEAHRHGPVTCFGGSTHHE